LYARGARLPPICAVPAALATILGSMFPEWPLLLRGLLVHIGAAALILSLAFPLRARPNRALAAALVLGQSSYAIYLIHQPLLLDLYLGPFRWLGVPPHSQAISLLVIIACAVALYLWVEVPARNWLRWKILGSDDR
jgi:peptidoglycan/LPS O-acetylase OafA/YrhL